VTYWWRPVSDDPRAQCSHVGCKLPAKARGLCGGHYYQLYRKAPPATRRPQAEPRSGRRGPPEWVDLDALAAANASDLRWMTGALPCAGVPTGVFEGAGHDPVSVYRYDDAERVCVRCPHRTECLARWLAIMPEYTDRDTGVFVGGCNPNQRRAVRKALRARAAA
jgi:hypothetical protein